MRNAHDLEGELSNARFLSEGGWRASRTRLATAGERLSLERVVWVAGDPGATSTIEFLEVDQVDAEGRSVAGVLFDPADRAAAQQELFERRAAESGPNALPAGLAAVMRALNAHDLGGLIAGLTADFVHHDRRRLGVTRSDGAEAYARSLRAIWEELSADARVDGLCEIASAPRAQLALTRTAGTNAAGGEFEAIALSVLALRDGRVARIELFDPEDRAAALARFEELRDGV